MNRKNRAQNLTEYAIILGLISAALIGMQVYIKRSVQGRLRDLANQISPEQYERGNTTANYTTTRSSGTTESQQRATFNRSVSEVTMRSGSETTVGDD